MFIDSHCHLDASEFGNAATQIAEHARTAGVSWIIVPAVERANFDKVASLSATLPSCVYALGIHPMYVPDAAEDDLGVLRERVERAINDDHFVAIGEIGLDFFIPELTTDADAREANFFTSEQLKIARDFRFAGHFACAAFAGYVTQASATHLRCKRRYCACLQWQRATGAGFIDLGFCVGFWWRDDLYSSLADSSSRDLAAAKRAGARNRCTGYFPRMAASGDQFAGADFLVLLRYWPSCVARPVADIARQTTDNVARVCPALAAS
jgi:hypothetical protein